jgi:hypothetical protein
MMLGIREVLEPRPSEEIPIVVDHDGEGHDPDPVGVYLHPDIPEATLVVLRPWVTKP